MQSYGLVESFAQREWDKFQFHEPHLKLYTSAHENCGAIACIAAILHTMKQVF